MLQRLEDRYVDKLADGVIGCGYTVICASYARAYIDLNRDESEWDSRLVAGGRPVHPSPSRVRAGLGLVPRHLYGVGELWRCRIDHADLCQRIAQVHQPYHAAIADALASARQRFGRAILIDLHSMPKQPGGEPQFVLGDRYGLTASLQLVDGLLALAEGQGLSACRNAPYAGAHTIERHADRSRATEAVQIEIDRSLYLGADFGPDADAVRRMTDMVEAIAASAERYLGMNDLGLREAAE